jgi:hypothetical protein
MIPPFIVNICPPIDHEHTLPKCGIGGLIWINVGEQGIFLIDFHAIHQETNYLKHQHGIWPY